MPSARRRPTWRAPPPRRSTPRSRPAKTPACSAGVPIGIKDLVATKDILTVMGSPLYRDFVPDEDDIVVERLKDAGAVIIGKTNVPEFGYSGVGHNPVFPTTRNPWNLDMTSGGSSAGSGASVAAGVAPFAIGSDGGGSIRIPSALCGLYGIKASMGRVPLYPGCRDERYPGVSSWESLEHVGPMSRTVADSALMLKVITGPDPRDRYSIPAADFDYVGADEGEHQGPAHRLQRRLGLRAGRSGSPARRLRSGARCSRPISAARSSAPIPAGKIRSRISGRIVAGDTDLTGMRRMMKGREKEMSPHLVDLLQRQWTAEEFTDAKMIRQMVCNRMWRFMANYDLLLTPTLAVPAFPLYMQGPEIIEEKHGHDRRLALLHLHLQSDRPAGRDHSRRLHQDRSAGRHADHRPPSGGPDRARRLRRLRTSASVGTQMAETVGRSRPLTLPLLSLPSNPEGARYEAQS